MMVAAPGVPGEPPLDGLERLKPVRAKIAAPQSRQHDHGHHRDPADPDHDGENMQCPSDNDLIHGWQHPGLLRETALRLGDRGYG